MNIDSNFFSLPHEVKKHILYESGLHLKDMASCNQICKLFDELGRESNFWERRARILLPKVNWTEVTDSAFKWKDWVIDFKKTERIILDTISGVIKTALVHPQDAPLKTTQYEQLEYYKNSNHPETQFRIGEAYIENLGAKDKYDKYQGLQYLYRSAEHNYLKALNYLGKLLEEGKKDPYISVDLDSASEFYQRAAKQGDKEAPFRVFACYEKQALKDSASGQNNLGTCYEKGMGCTPDRFKAFEYVQKAAEQGLAHAQINLGIYYECGIGCLPDPVKAFKYYLKAAEQGNGAGQNNLGICYEKGMGCEPDPVKAFEYMQKGANKGYALAQNNLGIYYERGIGCLPDPVIAFEYYQKAADQSDAQAQNNLGIYYEHGIGCLPDPVKAFEYVQKAAEQGYAPAQHNLNLYQTRNVSKISLNQKKVM